MNDLQILTVAIAIVFPVAALIYNNSRMTDLKDSSNNRITDLKDTLRSELQTGFGNVIERIRELQSEVGALRNDVKLLTGNVMEVDNRVTRIEDKLGIAPR